MLHKKAQGLPVSTIIIFAIALVVLVIVLIIFTGKTNIFSTGLKSCESQGGTCSPTACNELNPPKGNIPNHNCKEQNKGNYCCIGV